MTRRTTLEHRFVDTAPERLDDGVVYVSIPYATVLHRCACGCGSEVVTPLSPGGWTLLFDGRTVSLRPSIGNWNFPCRSHYWICNDRVLWATDRPGRHDHGRPLEYVPVDDEEPVEPAAPQPQTGWSWLAALRRWWHHRTRRTHR